MGKALKPQTFKAFLIIAANCHQTILQKYISILPKFYFCILSFDFGTFI